MIMESEIRNRFMNQRFRGRLLAALLAVGGLLVSASASAQPKNDFGSFGGMGSGEGCA